MKKLFFLFLALAASTLLKAQTDFPPLDKSPMDMCYYPVNYPVLKIQDKVTEPLVARVVYSRPKRDGRMIFGGLVEYGKVWRLGANEATEIEFYSNVRIGDKKITKGRYTLFAIVNENSWTFILNKETDTWGSFKYNPDKDIVRVNVPVEKLTDMVESLAMTFEKKGNTINLVVAWEKVKASLPITQ